MVQVYVNNIPVISSEKNKNRAKNEGKSVLEIIKAIESGEVSESVSVALSQTELLDEILREAKLVEAAGGIVFEPDGRFLLFFRRGWWDLPKGKIDKGESPEQAALREVWEECGLENLKIKAPLPDSYHTYREKGKLILKKTYWYFMSIPEKQNPILQTEEDIEDSVWVSFEEMDAYQYKTYPNILEVVRSSQQLLS